MQITLKDLEYSSQFIQTIVIVNGLMAEYQVLQS